MFSLLIVVFCVIGSSLASEMYFTQMPDSIPGNYTIWKYDSTSKKTTAMGSAYESVSNAFDFVSGSAVCQQNYYASAVDVMIAYGLLVADLSTGEQKILNQKLFGDLLIHNIWCDPSDSTGSSVYAVESTISNPEFYLYHITVDGMAVTNRKIGTFATPKGCEYAGSDTMFNAPEGVGEVWASWATKQQTGGYIQVMNTKNGAVSDYKVDGTTPAPGYPYSMVPLKAGQNTAMGILNGIEMKPHTRIAQFTLDDSKNSAKISDEEDGTDSFTGFQPWATEYAPALVHTIVSDQEDATVRTFDATTGKMLADVPMKEILRGNKFRVGALAVRNE